MANIDFLYSAYVFYKITLRRKTALMKIITTCFFAVKEAQFTVLK